ncbi:DNA/RNA nuclease SfsA [Thermoflexus sp.]|uniref:DNA/RNA nuclease SfsA n=1 Tax=Thermoflexus sp. TaxID=1969742 RepID=UPI002ADD5064|nr:DNA/RNA nuclease SfsA [Thermoflexus sp.]
MRWPPLTRGVFLRRLNRFAVEVRLRQRRVQAHLPNSGRLCELLVPGYPIWVARRDGRRRTRYDVQLVGLPDGTLVSADARMPNALFREAWEKGDLPPFRPYTALEAETPLGEGRVDFRLIGSAGVAYVEVKSVTLVEDGVGLFPDAPTERGRRHVRALIAARADGAQAFVLFIVQRPDAQAFRPHDAADPDFGRILRAAAAQGVQVLAYRCQVSLEEIRLADPIPVIL